MPGFLLHQGAIVTCSHLGGATPDAVNSRVLVSKQPTVTMLSPYSVGTPVCTLPSSSGGPCVKAMFTSAAIRVTSGGQPLLLSDSAATFMPTGAPLKIQSTQTRVSGK